MENQQLSIEPEALEGELIDAELVKKHKVFMELYRTGIAASSMALAGIYEGETYKADGYATFRDFVADEIGIGRIQGEVLAAEGPLFSILEDDPDKAEVLEAITSVEILRPIFRMAAERQIKVLEQAVAMAPTTRAGRPQLSGRLVTEVAERFFHWTPKASASRQKTAGDKPAGLVYLEKRLKDIDEAGITPELAVETYGPVEGWDHFESALEFLRLCKRASQSADRKSGLV